MKKTLVVLALCLVAVGVAFAGGGASCKKGDAKAVQLTGTIARADDSADSARVFRVANETTQYIICKHSKADLASLDGAQVRVTGKIVECDEGKELMIDSATRI